MATGTLTSTTIAARYKSLLKLTGTANDVLAADASAKYVEDGDGNDSVLSLSTTRVGLGNTAPASVFHLTGTMQVGVDGTGHDVIFYGDSPSSNMTWDQNGNTDGELILNDARLYINQDEDDNAIYIDSESTGNNVIEMYGKYGLYSEMNVSGGRAGYFTRNVAEAGSEPLVTIREQNANSTQPALKVTQTGAGYGISVDANANEKAIYVDHDGVEICLNRYRHTKSCSNYKR